MSASKFPSTVNLSLVILYFRFITMLIKAVRNGLGQLIVLGDLLTRPAKMKRSQASQAAVEQAAASLSLYQFRACPFCVKTRRTLHKLNVPVAVRDASNNKQHRQELLEQGGKVQVPCLRIEENGGSTWLYESRAINDYLHERFGAG